jgi:hypothetical protein
MGIRVANKKVIEDGGMDETSVLKWGIKNAGIIEKWDRRIKLVSEYLMFKSIRKQLDFKGKIGTMISDAFRIMTMVHLRFEK